MRLSGILEGLTAVVAGLALLLVVLPAVSLIIWAVFGTDVIGQFSLKIHFNTFE